MIRNVVFTDKSWESLLLMDSVASFRDFLPRLGSVCLVPAHGQSQDAMKNNIRFMTHDEKSMFTEVNSRSSNEIRCLMASIDPSRTDEMPHAIFTFVT